MPASYIYIYIYVEREREREREREIYRERERERENTYDICSTAVLCRGPATLLPRGCRGHTTGKRKGGLEGRRGEQRGNVSFNTLILYQTCASHHV